EDRTHDAEPTREGEEARRGESPAEALDQARAEWGTFAPEGERREEASAETRAPAGAEPGEARRETAPAPGEPADEPREIAAETVETFGGDEFEEQARQRSRSMRHYKIQEVVKRRQIMLVQVTKEE